MPTDICDPFSSQLIKRKAPATPPNPNRKLCRIDFSSQLSKQIIFGSGTAKQTQFPQDLIDEILVRLRVKSLVRFKCVSKLWLSLFSDQQFISRHLKTRTCTQTRQDFIVHGPQARDFAIATLNGDWILFQPLETNFKVEPSEEIFSVVGHCNGLICLQFYSRETDRSSVLIWNPSTKEQKKFLTPECRQGNEECFGFSYHSASDHYRVVLVTIAYHKSVKVQSLSLKTGSWRTGKCNIPYFFTLDITVQHVNGCIYWLINHGGLLGCGVASFDLGSEILREEESLRWVLSNRNSIYFVLELAVSSTGESLCLVDSEDQVHFDVWLMKEDGVTQTKSWIKLFTISSTDDNFTKPLNIEGDQIVPVCFTSNGKVLIFAIEREEYTLYDPSDQSFNNNLELSNFMSGSNPRSPYFESLVSPGR